MTQATTAIERLPAPIVELRAQLEQRAEEYRAALPSHITPEQFQRVTLTAIQQNPKLLNVERRSLFNALMKAAQDGLLPDGRDAVLVVYRDKNRGEIAQYQPMVGGIRRLVQQSGEIVRFEQYVVYEHDTWDFELGDRAQIMHRPKLTGPRGKPIIVYSIAEHRGGSLSREVMTVDEVERARASSPAPDSPAWRNWWSEMARKTVAKRHAKVLPRSSRLDLILEREDRGDDGPGPAIDPPAKRRPGRPRLAAALDRLGAPSPGTLDEAEPVEPPPTDEPPHDADGVIDEAPADDVAGDDYNHLDPDIQRGIADAKAGHRTCLDPDIKRDDRRFAKWQHGYLFGKESGQ